MNNAMGPPSNREINSLQNPPYSSIFVRFVETELVKTKAKGKNGRVNGTEIS